MTAEMSGLRAWLANLPKAELHLHLEGAIPLQALWDLIAVYGGDPSIRSVEDLRRRLTYADFPAFIEAWIWKNGFLRTYGDFAFIAEAVARSLAAQKILYAEVFFSPSRFADQGLMPQKLVQAIRRGFDRVPETELWLIPDLVRDHGPARAARTLREIAEVRDCGVVGIGLGGSEHRYPAAPFAEVYAAARAMGLRTTAHAGEAAGADSVRAAVEDLGADRIGHATRAEDDPALLDLLAERSVPLELCPLSNLATGVISDITCHPVRRYWERGLAVTINTDDPGMFHNTLVEEYALLHEAFGFTAREIRQLVLNALDAAWRPPAEGPSLRARFSADPGWSLPPS